MESPEVLFGTNYDGSPIVKETNVTILFYTNVIEILVHYLQQLIHSVLAFIEKKA